MAVTINASTTAGLVQTADTTGILQLQTAGTTAATITASQNIGVGTASPTQKLDVNGTAKATTLMGTTLSDGTNSTSTTNAVQGSAKAWVNCNGSGGAVIRASYNVSSLTYNAAGDYTVNFTNAFVDANYCAVSMGSDATAAVVNVRTTSGYTTTTLRLWTGNPNHTTGDCLYINVACFR